MSDNFSISNESIQNAESRFANTARKMETADRSEKSQNEPARPKDSVSFSGEGGAGGALFKVNQAENAAEVDPKLPSTQQEQYHSTLNVMA